MEPLKREVYELWMQPLEQDGGQDSRLPHAIGMFGSFALVVNNISGPGLLNFASAFQQAGWLPSVCVILIVASLSACIATMLCDVMARIQAESLHSRERLEFSSIFAAVLGQKWFVLTQWLFYLNLFAQNVAAIVATAQATDMLVATVFGQSYAIDLSLRQIVSWTAGSCGRRHSMSCAPFHVDTETAVESPFLLTAGYGVCFITLAPLGFVSLKENMLAQKLSFVLLCALCAEFIIAFSKTRGTGYVPIIGQKYRDLPGVVMFNFAFCVTRAPSVYGYFTQLHLYLSAGYHHGSMKRIRMLMLELLFGLHVYVLPSVTLLSAGLVCCDCIHYWRFNLAL